MNWFGRGNAQPKTGALSAEQRLAGFHSLVAECLERGLRLDKAGSSDAARYYQQARHPQHRCNSLRLTPSAPDCRLWIL